MNFLALYLSYISGNITFRARKVKKSALKNFLYFGKWKLLAPTLKNVLYFRRELAKPGKQTVIFTAVKHKEILLGNFLRKFPVKEI